MQKEDLKKEINRDIKSNEDYQKHISSLEQQIKALQIDIQTKDIVINFYENRTQSLKQMLEQYMK